MPHRLYVVVNYKYIGHTMDGDSVVYVTAAGSVGKVRYVVLT